MRPDEFTQGGIESPVLTVPNSPTTAGVSDRPTESEETTVLGPEKVSFKRLRELPSDVQNASNATDSNSSTSSVEPTAHGLDTIRLRCRLNDIKFGIWLNLTEPPVNFVDAIRKEFKRKGIRFVQRDIGIWLKPDKMTVDDHSYYVSLYQDELEHEWPDSLDWIQENRKVDSNVMYGVFQFESD